MNASPYFKIEVFTPEEVVDVVISALADAHAGEIGLYDHCAAVSVNPLSPLAWAADNPADDANLDQLLLKLADD